jgi:hypothetical protein
MKKLWLGKLLESSLTVGDVLLAAADQGPEAQTLRFARGSGTRVRADQLAPAVEQHARVEDPVSIELEDGSSVDPVDPGGGVGVGAERSVRASFRYLHLGYCSCVIPTSQALPSGRGLE